MKLTTVYIDQRLREEQILAVHQVAMLEWLNGLESAEALSGSSRGAGPIADDPNRGFGDQQRDYDIGLTTAERILGHRDALDGFSSLHDLVGIPYFGVDKFDDLLYTFKTLRTPVPTQVGIEFDNFISAIGALELYAVQQRIPKGHFPSFVRKLLYHTTMEAEGSVNLDWNQIIPAAQGLNPPVAWAVTPNLVKAVGYLRTHTEVNIQSKTVNVSHLLAGLDARLNPADPNFSNGLVQLQDNQKVATYIKTLAGPVYRYLDAEGPQAANTTTLNSQRLSNSFNAQVGISAIYGIADAYAMKYDPSNSLCWNLLNYYTEAGSPVAQRVSKFTDAIGLGQIREGYFAGDTEPYRAALQDSILKMAFALGLENARVAEVNAAMQSGSPEEMAYRALSGTVGDLFLDLLGGLRQSEANPPGFVSWNRLEGRPRTTDFSRSLRAEVRDALWFLSRQWQLGEFKGEDTGSAIKVKVHMRSSQVNKYAPQILDAVDYDDDLPLETVVERDVVRPDLTLRLEMGEHWERLLRHELASSPNPCTPGEIDAVCAQFSSNSAFHFILPPAASFPEVHAHPEMLMLYAAVGNGRRLDGGALFAALQSATADSFLSGVYSAAVPGKVLAAGTAFKAWFHKTYNHPEPLSGKAWHTGHLEYQFKCSAPSAAGRADILTAKEYASGHLDWYNFDFEKVNSNTGGTLTPAAADLSKITNDQLTLVPSELRWPGMPLPRWWQFEEGSVNLDRLYVAQTDPTLALLMQFVTLYSNDWYILPYSLPTGSLCEVKDVVIQDVFGQRVRVQPSGAGDANDWRRWSMYTLHREQLSLATADTRVYLPPVAVKVQESGPIEEVQFLRDEMANMVWAIEKTVPDGLGSGMDGYESALQLAHYIQSQSPPIVTVTPEPNAAKIKYVLGNTVPENWIPFIPVRMGGILNRDIQLRRASMPRLIQGQATSRVRPRTDLLRTNYDSLNDIWQPYHVHEEEVPRSGAIVKQTWQRTRWFNGEVVTWLGRRKLNGRGEINSGLVFDQVEEK